MSQDSLRAIVVQTKDIVSLLVENGGEMNEQIEAALISLEDRTPAKIDAYAVVMERMQMESEYWKSKADYYAKVGKACANVREKLRENLKYAMEQLGTREIAGRDVRFRLSPTTPKLVIAESLLDSEYFKTETIRTPDKDRIKEDLKAGKQIDGATLMESFAVRQYANSKGGDNE